MTAAVGLCPSGHRQADHAGFAYDGSSSRTAAVGAGEIFTPPLMSTSSLPSTRRRCSLQFLLLLGAAAGPSSL